MAPAAAVAAVPAVQAIVRVGRAIPWWAVLRYGGSVALAAMAAGFVFVKRALGHMYASAKLLPATAKQLKDEDLDSNPLYRTLPVLKGKVAWRALGNYPTPVHCFEVKLSEESSETVVFYAKREDLSSPHYGGNKVRGLQYTLGCYEAHAEEVRAKIGLTPQLLTLGSGGSNQVIATKIHASFLPSLSGTVEGITPLPDEPDMDNTLNYLSALSLPGPHQTFGTGLRRVFALLGMLPGTDLSAEPWVLMPGGNNPLGVLGHVGAAIELAEQIQRGEMPDPDGIVVAMGSSCTVTGLMVGIVIARSVGLKAFQQPGFQVHGIPVHEGMTSMQRYLGLIKSESIPMMTGRGIREVCQLIKNAGGPDYTDQCLKLMREEFDCHCDHDIVGKYGAHSKVSEEAKRLYDRTAKAPVGAPHLWLCGHFSAKSFALVVKLLKQSPQKKLVFWQTKSQVQPLGQSDEWEAFQEERRTNRTLAKWGVVGGLTGHPSYVPSDGLVEAAGGSKTRTVEAPESYKGLMTVVKLPAAQ